MSALVLQSKKERENAEIKTRLHKMASELAFAVSQADRRVLRDWGVGTGQDFVVSLGRRAKNVGKAVLAVGRWTAGEVKKAHHALSEQRLSAHLANRSKEIGKSGKETVVGAKDTLSHSIEAFRKSPAEVGPQLLMLVLASLVVSGGADGDGGAPDLDLMLGIDAHRSLLTHSIVMGAALETSVLALLRLTRLVHAHLPDGHDPLWNNINFHAESLLEAAKTGASIGMSYHLLVDGLVQPAAYKDLPFSLPMEAHQGIFVTNAVVELTDVQARKTVADTPFGSEFGVRCNAIDTRT